MSQPGTQESIVSLFAGSDLAPSGSVTPDPKSALLELSSDPIHSSSATPSSKSEGPSSRNPHGRAYPFSGSSYVAGDEHEDNADDDEEEDHESPQSNAEDSDESYVEEMKRSRGRKKAPAMASKRITAKSKTARKVANRSTKPAAAAAPPQATATATTTSRRSQQAGKTNNIEEPNGNASTRPRRNQNMNGEGASKASTNPEPVGTKTAKPKTSTRVPRLGFFDRSKEIGSGINVGDATNDDDVIRLDINKKSLPRAAEGKPVDPMPQPSKGAKSLRPSQASRMVTKKRAGPEQATSGAKRQKVDHADKLDGDSGDHDPYDPPASPAKNGAKGSSKDKPSTQKGPKHVHSDPASSSDALEKSKMISNSRKKRSPVMYGSSSKRLRHVVNPTRVIAPSKGASTETSQHEHFSKPQHDHHAQPSQSPLPTLMKSSKLKHIEDLEDFSDKPHDSAGNLENMNAVNGVMLDPSGFAEEQPGSPIAIFDDNDEDREPTPGPSIQEATRPRTQQTAQGQLVHQAVATSPAEDTEKDVTVEFLPAHEHTRKPTPFNEYSPLPAAEAKIPLSLKETVDGPAAPRHERVLRKRIPDSGDTGAIKKSKTDAPSHRSPPRDKYAPSVQHAPSERTQYRISAVANSDHDELLTENATEHRPATSKRNDVVRPVQTSERIPLQEVQQAEGLNRMKIPEIEQEHASVRPTSRWDLLSDSERQKSPQAAKTMDLPPLHPKSVAFAQRAAQSQQHSGRVSRSDLQHRNGQQGVSTNRQLLPIRRGTTDKAYDHVTPNTFRSCLHSGINLGRSDSDDTVQSAAKWQMARDAAEDGLVNSSHQVTTCLLRELKTKEASLRTVTNDYDQGATKITTALARRQEQERTTASATFKEECSQLTSLYKGLSAKAQKLGTSVLPENRNQEYTQWKQQASHINDAIRAVREDAKKI